LLLQDNLRFDAGVTIVSFVKQPGQLQIGIVRTASPQDGVLTLIFAEDPLELRQWTVLDAQRHLTRVTLSDVQLGGDYPDKLFEFVDPKFFQNNIGGGG
jgi:outer membrane lipoprotein-sorting protein